MTTRDNCDHGIVCNNQMILQYARSLFSFDSWDFRCRCRDWLSGRVLDRRSAPNSWHGDRSSWWCWVRRLQSTPCYTLNGQTHKLQLLHTLRSVIVTVFRLQIKQQREWPGGNGSTFIDAAPTQVTLTIPIQPFIWQSWRWLSHLEGQQNQQ